MHRVFSALLMCAWTIALVSPVGAAGTQSVSPLQPFAGHWRCTGGPDGPAERSYVLDMGGLVGRSDSGSVKDGTDAVSWERVAFKGGTHEMTGESLEGDSSGSRNDDGSIVLQGRGDPNTPPFTIRYAAAGDTLERTVTSRGNVTAERCTREPELGYPLTCADRNVGAATLHAAPVEMTAQLISEHPTGMIYVVVTLDDRSNVVWTTVDRTDSPLFVQPALHAVRASTFRTEVRNCRPIAADYIFVVQFGRAR